MTEMAETAETMVMPERIDAYPTHRIGGFAVGAGRTLPFGATRVPRGINFSVFSNHAASLVLVLFQRGADRPMAEIPIPPEFRIGGVHAMTVFGLDPETIEYCYRADGPYEPGRGHRFEPDRLLIDPYAKALSGREAWGRPDRRPFRGRVLDEDFDWEEDRPLGLAPEDLVIYELHVRGFTRHPSAGVTAPGTYAGLVQKIPYLRELGVNCVELLPVFEFDELDNPHSDPAGGRRLYNYWGYNTVGFFAPKAGYAASGSHGMEADEFKNLVKQLHRAGIEVILDVVFNHTAEGDERGPTLSFRGLDNRTYYMLTRDGHYYNFSGTGNTFNCNHPVVRAFVLDCLRYWAAEFHIDGFRFDLASILGRAPDGTPLNNPPLIESLALDPVLRDCKLIAEAWDAAGLWQVGSFSSHRRWSEWNGRYRDTLRRFIKGDPGMAGELAACLVGSPDLYGARGPAASVNFVTAHDGFTLHDLVAYDRKHNEANGEGGRDGDNANNSWNHGHEGPTDDPEITALRDRQVRNAVLLLLLSHGIPMLVAGDEAGRTQHGNNNAYCHDEPLSWFDWTLAEDNADLIRFVRHAIAFRMAHRCVRRRLDDEPRRPAGDSRRAPDDSRRADDDSRRPFPWVSWHGVRAWEPDWAPHNRLLAMMLCANEEADCVYLAANAYWESQDLELPALPGDLAWHLFADTAAAPPQDIHEPGHEPPLPDGARVRIGPRSVLALVARPSNGKVSST
ncbi:glycogen debranching protein GlgX [Actinomadura barringtoniae]|uniref:Glycogen debranching protein GlgX n=1 Tax=Actinomadura barringtoniae TaxID=1427535 RepID=A0A939T6Y3_9ACTN|nr:glycogen debranching protein GlgX [Actinomadura barringtoniae]MBO2448762.1 glycogen debranching protein GlgX [Actinomadura barringtoniae]